MQQIENARTFEKFLQEIYFSIILFILKNAYS